MQHFSFNCVKCVSYIWLLDIRKRLIWCPQIFSCSMRNVAAPTLLLIGKSLSLNLVIWWIVAAVLMMSLVETESRLTVCRGTYLHSGTRVSSGWYIQTYARCIIMQTATWALLSIPNLLTKQVVTSPYLENLFFFYCRWSFQVMSVRWQSSRKKPWTTLGSSLSCVSPMCN